VRSRGPPVSGTFRTDGAACRRNARPQLTRPHLSAGTPCPCSRGSVWAWRYIEPYEVVSLVPSDG